MKKILITGGAGFIGSHLADKLLEEGNEVFVIDDISTGSLSNVEHLKGNKKFHIKVESILNKQALEDMVFNSDEVYHLAAAVGVKYIIDNPLKSIQVNVQGTENVLELCSKHNKKVLIASTSEVYGKNEKVPFSETDDRVLGSTKIIRWSYACTKELDEFLAFAYWREKNLPLVVVRFFNTVGPRQSERYGMVIPRFVKQALSGEPLTVFGDGEQTRSFTYIDDVVGGIIKLMNAKEAEGDIFNIGNGKVITIKDLAQKVIDKTKSPSKINLIPYEKAYKEGFEDMRHRAPDISKIKSVIGYEPEYDIDEILNKTIEFFNKK